MLSNLSNSDLQIRLSVQQKPRESKRTEDCAELWDGALSRRVDELRLRHELAGQRVDARGPIPHGAR